MCFLAQDSRYCVRSVHKVRRLVCSKFSFSSSLSLVDSLFVLPLPPFMFMLRTYVPRVRIRTRYVCCLGCVDIYGGRERVRTHKEREQRGTKRERESLLPVTEVKRIDVASYVRVTALPNIHGYICICIMPSLRV